jgi:hypothetical protein
MSLLGNLFRSAAGGRNASGEPVATSETDRLLPEIRALGERLAAIERRLANLGAFASADLPMKCEQALRSILAEREYSDPRRLERFGRKVYSQNDEDGVIDEIFRRIGVASRSFVEFGVSDGRECNTLKRLLEGWRGLWIESGAEFCAGIRRAFPEQLAAGALELQESMVSAENIDALIGASRVAREGELDLLSIDIDGNDYYVFQAIRSVRARVVVIEYNAKFPPPLDLVIRYDPQHMWDGSDYMGASLQALTNLANRIGYQLVATNVTGANAFFVRNDLAGERFFSPATAEALYNPPRYWATSGFVVGHRPYAGPYRYTSDAALARGSPDERERA